MVAPALLAMSSGAPLNLLAAPPDLHWLLLQGPIPPSWAHLPSLTLINLGSNVGVCGGEPSWRAGTQVHIDATSLAQSCIMVNTSGALAGAVLGKQQTWRVGRRVLRQQRLPACQQR